MIQIKNLYFIGLNSETIFTAVSWKEYILLKNRQEVKNSDYHLCMGCMPLPITPVAVNWSLNSWVMDKNVFRAVTVTLTIGSYH